MTNTHKTARRERSSLRKSRSGPVQKRWARRAGAQSLFALLGATVATVTLVGTAGAATHTAPVANPDQPVFSHPIASQDAAQTDAAVRAYWTVERMKTATPADIIGPVGSESTKHAQVSSGPATHVPGATPQISGSNPNSAQNTTDFKPMDVSAAQRWTKRHTPPASTTGKVFFVSDSENKHFRKDVRYACSGSVVNSEAKNTVFTAGHCVHGGKGGTWHKNWVFIPDYLNGDEPYGRWSPRQLWSLKGWMNNSDFRYDIGAAVINLDNSDRRIANVVGGQGIAWNHPRGQHVHAFGYPADSPFEGKELFYCSGSTLNDGANIGIGCNMTGGSSGGPWLMRFDGTLGYVNGIVSYGYSTDPNHLYSPYFGDGAGNLYNAVRNLA